MTEIILKLYKKIKRKTRKAVDLVSVMLVCLFPVVTGVIFFRLLFMAGVPVWFYVLQGFLFVFSLALGVYFFSAGLIHAIRFKKENR